MTKVRYMLFTQPVCAGCMFPLDVHTIAPCMNCGQHADTFIPGVVLECDWRCEVTRPDAKAFRRLLPWRVRFRLRWRRCVDRVGIWLVNHQHLNAAKRLWRIKS